MRIAALRMLPRLLEYEHAQSVMTALLKADSWLITKHLVDI